MRKTHLNELRIGRLIAITIAIGLTNIPVPSHANEASVTVSGTAESFCAVSSTFSSSSNSASFDNSLNSPDGSLRSTEAYFMLGAVRCNYTANVSIKSTNGGLKREEPTTNPSQPFVEKVNYQIKVSWNGQDILEHTTNGTLNSGPEAYQSLAAKSGDIEITALTVADSEISLIPGTYKDIIIINVGDSI